MPLNPRDNYDIVFGRRKPEDVIREAKERREKKAEEKKSAPPMKSDRNLDRMIAVLFGGKTPAEKEEADAKNVVKNPPKLPGWAKPARGVPDISIAIEAQRIYSPDRPPAPPSKTKAPPAEMKKQGSAPSMDQSGAWGKGEGK